MSNAAATDAAPPKKGNKKLIIIIAAVAVLVLGGGGAALMMKKKSADAEADEDGGAHKPAKAAAKHNPKAAPTFVPLEPFTVNLADREAERYVQVGITLEISDGKVADSIKVFMPAIRNNILLALADRTAAELMDREGKRKLAEKIRKETSKALGADVEDDHDEAAEDDSEKKPAKKGKKKKPAPPELPVTAVHFSNFIIQ
jgi:flagellar FliL protein